MKDLPVFFSEDWQSFLEMSHDGIVIANHEGRIVYMNPAAERLEEVGKEEILGRFAKELEDEGVYQVSVTVKVFQSGKKETCMDIKGGKQLLLTGIPIYEGKQIKWVYVNERDITELMQMRQDKKFLSEQMNQYKMELQRLSAKVEEQEEIVVKSPKMKQNMELLQRLAMTDTSILLEGESGVGKDVHARWIHKNSLRASKPFVKIDCGALSENLLESELFGYVEGAFTGARRQGKRGLVEEADGGTLFLDEIGEMPLALQMKLLRLVQDKTFLAVGGTEEKQVDIRIISASNKNLKEMVDRRQFRQDLFYRLNVIPIKLPPLRERPEDIFGFIQYFLKAYNTRYGYRKKLSPSAVSMLCGYRWPGNVRELSNIMERLVVITPKSLIEDTDVVMAIPDLHMPGKKAMSAGNDMTYHDTLAAFEEQYLQRAIENGNTLEKTAAQTGLSESTLKRKLKKYGLRTKGGHFGRESDQK